MGKRKKYSDGKVHFNYSNFLGYKKNDNGKLEIIEEEARVVSLIYRLFIEGKTASGIGRYLMDMEVKTPSGKKIWYKSTVESILTNEKYKGDELLQKKFIVDFLKAKMKVNEGEVPQYNVENNHPPIKGLRLSKDKAMEVFIMNLIKQPLVVKAWDESLWVLMIDKAVVGRDGSIKFVFDNGTEIEE